MIVLTVILGLLALTLLISGAYRLVVEYEGGFLLSFGVVLGICWGIMFMCISNVQFSDATFTGYIYSKDSFQGVTRYHIRFSENAGEDSQPSFCVNDGARDQSKLDALVGTSRKVTVFIPSVAWYFSDDLWHCPSNAQLKSVEPATASASE